MGPVELLEKRSLLSASISNDVLLVAGTRKNDRITIALERANLIATVNGVSESIATSSFTSIVVDGRRGDDTISVLNTGGVIPFPMKIWGQAGRDSIVGGDGPERIFAGDDDDTVNGGGGRDTIYGGAGNDSLRGGGGSDLIDGEDGNDTIRGDGGNDRLFGGNGFDRLRGSDGNDELHGGASKDFLAGEAGDDSIYGEGGNDVLDGGAGKDFLDGGRGDDLENDPADDQHAGTSAGGKIDLRDNKLIVSGATAGSWDGSAYTGVTGLIASGYNGGTQDGSGIMTSQSAAISPNLLTQLVSVSADDSGYAGGTFGGQSVAAGDQLVMYTWGGDANLDGKVNQDDYFQIDSHFNQPGQISFQNGDFNYDGQINGDDYFIIDSNLGHAPTS